MPIKIKQPVPVTGKVKEAYVAKKFMGKEKKITSIGPNVGGFSNPKLKKKKTTRKSKSPRKSPRRDGLIAGAKAGNRPESSEGQVHSRNAMVLQG